MEERIVLSIIVTEDKAGLAVTVEGNPLRKANEKQVILALAKSINNSKDHPSGHVIVDIVKTALAIGTNATPRVIELLERMAGINSLFDDDGLPTIEQLMGDD